MEHKAAKMVFFVLGHAIYTGTDIEEIKKNLGPCQSKRLDAELCAVYSTWTWELAPSRFCGPTLYKTNVKLFDAITNEEIK